MIICTTNIAKPIDLMTSCEKATATILDESTTKMQQALVQTQISTLNHDAFNTQIGIRLDITNYDLWSQVTEMYIAGKDKLGYIIRDILQLELVDLTF